MAKPVLISGPLQTERLPNGRRKLLRPLEVDLGLTLDVDHRRWKGPLGLSSQGFTLIVVPEGFDTDFSSIPWFARAFMGSIERHDLAGVFHDFLYRIHFPREPADEVWWIIARSGSRRVNAAQGFLGWSGLRLGGWFAYNRT